MNKNGSKNFTFKGHPISEIVNKYLECKGEPEVGERHSFYNQMAKDFSLIVNNDPEVLVDVLPLFEGKREDRRAQCISQCRINEKCTKLPYLFQTFLQENGFWDMPEDLEEDDMDEWNLTNTDDMPTLPPVFREFCSIAPQDFKYPTIVSLLPIMGTMTSYLRSMYVDNTKQSTTFFNVIYAPSGTGKSFVMRPLENLFTIINKRDGLADVREQLFVTKKAGKGGNERSPKDPHTKQTVIPAINSQPEFLKKMRDNKGHHMFSFTPEMDTFAKGTEGGGIDKRDMFRVAWDNGIYGQSYKSADTFKGKVKLYYNFLCTGTPKQVLSYFRNVENGMVTRICVCPIENQRFAKRPLWKQLSDKAQQVIDAFKSRCDENTYTEPADFDLEEAYYIENAKEYDEKVPWQYEFKPFQEIDLSWTFEWLDEWQEKQRKLASMADDIARDIFRRREAVKGFRLALLCHACWNKVGKKEREIIKNFVLWFMNKDLENSLALFGAKVNDEAMDTRPAPKNQPALFKLLPDRFTCTQMREACKKLGVGTADAEIRHRWNEERFIKKLSQSTFQKTI